MNKKKILLLLSVVLLSSTIIYVVGLTKQSIVTPKLKLQLSTKGELEPEGAFDAWIYVTNPCKLMERQGSQLLFHVAEVNYFEASIEVESVLTDHYRFYPNGTIEELIYGGVGYLPGYELRWDSIIRPMETTLVFYGGWKMDPTDIGECNFNYVVNVDLDGNNYDLEESFTITVTK